MGSLEGNAEGMEVGTLVGRLELGSAVGAREDSTEGGELGPPVGSPEGLSKGDELGTLVG